MSFFSELESKIEFLICQFRTLFLNLIFFISSMIFEESQSNVCQCHEYEKHNCETDDVDPQVHGVFMRDALLC